MVGSQTASLTPGPSFAHNLGEKCPNAQCEGIFDIYASRPFQWHQEHPNARCFCSCCWALNIRESRRTPNPQLFQVLGFTPTLGQVRVATFFMKLTLDAPTIASTKSNLCLLTNVKTLLGLNVIMPLLGVVYSLIKISQLHDVFVCFHSSNEILWRGCILDVLWQPILFPRWCVWKFPCTYQFCSWKHKSLMDHISKCKNKSFNFSTCWVSCLDHICKLDWGIWFCDKTCMKRLRHLWNDNVQNLPINLLQTSNANSQTKIWWMHLGLCASNIGCN